MADSDRSMGGPENTSQSTTPTAGTAGQFEWVHDSTSQRSLIRRHTMKTSWRKRSELSNAQKVNRNATRELRPLLQVPMSDEVKSPGPVDAPIKTRPKALHKRHATKSRRGVNEGEAVSESAASVAGEEMQSKEQGIQQLAIRSPGRVIPRTWAKSNADLPYGFSGAHRRTALTSSPKVNFVDPFGTTPIKLGYREQSLLHWWLGPYSTLMFGQSSRPGDGHAVKEIDGGTFYIPAAFHAGLSYMAFHRGQLTGEDWTVSAIYHKTEALNLVNKQLEIPELATSDAAIYSVVRLLTLEDWWGSRDVYNIHLKGLERMLRIRGGSESISSNLDLESCYLGLRLCGRPRWFNPPVAPSPQGQPLLVDVSQPSITLWETRQELLNSCNEFAQFFLEIHSLHQATLTLQCRPSATSHPYICEVINIIRSPLNQDSDARPPYETHVGETISVVLLFYMTVVWKDYILSTQPQRDLLLDLENGLRKTVHRWRSAFGMLIFCMYKIETFDLGHTKRFHSVLGLMDVARCLHWESWMKVRNVLQDVLLGDTSSGSAWSDLSEASLVECLIR